MVDCLFCDNKRFNIILENELAYAIYDKYPVNNGHVLVISKRHYQSFFDAILEEVQAIYQLIKQVKSILDQSFQPTGYNIGVNVNKRAGQTIMHLHVHMIPRYDGDVENPVGGIRNLKPSLVPYRV